MNDRLSEVLGGLESGQRVWFWISPRATAPYPPLLLETFADDPGMDRLKADAARIPLPRGAMQCIGAGHVSKDGRVQFGSPLASREMLETVSRWVTDNATERPELVRLRGAKFVKVNQGKVVEVIEDDSLWSGLP